MGSTTISTGKTSGSVIAKGGQQLSTLEEWHSYAPPKGRTHWKDGRSAKENARLWLEAAPDFPSGVAEVLGACGSVGNIRSWSAEPEARVKFDEFPGEPANLDVLVKAEDEKGPVVIGVEAKADEAFGSTVERTLSQAQKRLQQNSRSKGVERIGQLAHLFALDLDRRILDLRYQLLTLTAATIAEADRQSAQRAIVIVQEFVSSFTTAERRAVNARDLEAFLVTVFGHTGSIGPGTIAGPFRMGGIGALYFGKTETVI